MTLPDVLEREKYRLPRPTYGKDLELGDAGKPWSGVILREGFQQFARSLNYQEVDETEDRSGVLRVFQKSDDVPNFGSTPTRVESALAIYEGGDRTHAILSNSEDQVTDQVFQDFETTRRLFFERRKPFNASTATTLSGVKSALSMLGVAYLVSAGAITYVLNETPSDTVAAALYAGALGSFVVLPSTTFLARKLLLGKIKGRKEYRFGSSVTDALLAEHQHRTWVKVKKAVYNDVTKEFPRLTGGDFIESVFSGSSDFLKGEAFRESQANDVLPLEARVNRAHEALVDEAKVIIRFQEAA